MEGQYQVGVTTFQQNEIGKFELNLKINSAITSSKEKTLIKLDSEINGILSNDNLETDDGRRYDEYLLTIEKNIIIQIDLESTKFDTQLIVIALDSRMLRNDDVSQSNRNSRLLIKCDFKGDLLIKVLPYSAREKGEYKLSVKKLENVPLNAVVENLQGMSEKNPKFYGIFVGISDYASVINDLRFCKDDAIKLAKTFEQLRLINNQNYTLLTDKQATQANIKQAFDRMSTKVTKDDVFVFFYSGHGIQGDFDEKAKDEIDRREEYLYVYDGKIHDDTLNTYFNKIKSKLTVITIDCCFAGGFRRDLISEPNRVGFFSSEEDLTSAVAAKFSAGGFLSFFFRKSIEGAADLNKDNTLTIGELSHYLQTSYAKEVSSQYAETSEGARSYQHIVVDRGGVSVNTPFIYR
jgi:hypothetical protein